jgi:hypothetical protein
MSLVMTYRHKRDWIQLIFVKKVLIVGILASFFEVFHDLLLSFA